MEIHDQDTMASTHLQAIFNYLALYTSPRPLVYLCGVRGSGKTFLAQKLHERLEERVLTLSWSEENRYRAQWVVLADNASHNSCLHKSYPRHSLSPSLLKDIGQTNDNHFTIVIDNAHWCGQDIVKDIANFQQHFHSVRLILLGEPSRRQQKQLRFLHTEFITLEKPTWQETRDFLARKSNIPSPETVFTPRFVRRLLSLSRGDVTQLKYAAVATELLLQAEQTHMLSREQQRLIYRTLGDQRRRWLRWSALWCGTIVAVAMGWTISPSLSNYLPLPPTFLPPAPVIKESDTTDLTRQVASDREALSQLFATWGYDVPVEEAWCDRAQRAALLCKSGKSSLKMLAAQGLPWITSLRVGQKTIPVVIVRVTPASLDVLVGRQTWTLTREWFETVWQGDYLLLWKPSPMGETSISRDSDEEDIQWLETTLNNALNLTSSPTGEWSAVLIEKVKLFQKQNQLTADGVVGFSTLTRLWQASGESARLFNDDDKQ